MKKNPLLFSSKDKSKKLKCRLLQILLGVLRVKISSFLRTPQNGNAVGEAQA